MARKKLDAAEVPGVIPANFPAAESAFVPAATAPPAAAVDRPNELAAQDFAACPNSFHVCTLLGALAFVFGTDAACGYQRNVLVSSF